MVANLNRSFDICYSPFLANGAARKILGWCYIGLSSFDPLITVCAARRSGASLSLTGTPRNHHCATLLGTGMNKMLGAKNTILTHTYSSREPCDGAEMVRYRGMALTGTRCYRDAVCLMGDVEAGKRIISLLPHITHTQSTSSTSDHWGVSNQRTGCSS